MASGVSLLEISEYEPCSSFARSFAAVSIPIPRIMTFQPFCWIVFVFDRNSWLKTPFFE